MRSDIFLWRERNYPTARFASMKEGRIALLKRLLSLGAIVGTLAFSQAAHAATLSYSTSGMLAENVLSFFNNGASNFNGYTGQISNTLTGGPAGYPSTFIGYCVDLQDTYQQGETVSVNNTSALTRNGISPNTGYRVAWLYNTYAASVSTNVQAAALQVAIWEALYNNTLDDTFSSGWYTLGASQNMQSQAKIYIDALQTAIGNGSYLTNNATWFNANGTGQDVLGPSSTPVVSQVPEPGLMSLFAGSSLSGLWMLRRKRKQTR